MPTDDRADEPNPSSDESAGAAAGGSEPTPTVTTTGGGSDADPTGESTAATAHGTHPADADQREFGWRGGVLLAVMAFALVVAPIVVYLRPPGLPWRVTLILFPLLPALLLGAVAVWATARP